MNIPEYPIQPGLEIDAACRREMPFDPALWRCLPGMVLALPNHNLVQALNEFEFMACRTADCLRATSLPAVSGYSLAVSRDPLGGMLNKALVKRGRMHNVVATVHPYDADRVAAYPLKIGGNLARRAGIIALLSGEVRRHNSGEYLGPLACEVVYLDTIKLTSGMRVTRHFGGFEAPTLPVQPYPVGSVRMSGDLPRANWTPKRPNPRTYLGADGYGLKMGSFPID